MRDVCSLLLAAVLVFAPFVSHADLPAGADAVPKLSIVTITTEPSGAMIQIDDKPARKGPIVTKLKAEARITVRATRTGYHVAKKTFSLSAAATQEFELLLKRKRRTTTTRRPKPSRTSKTKPKPIATPPKPLPTTPRPFDPNSPAGTE